MYKIPVSSVTEGMDGLMGAKYPYNRSYLFLKLLFNNIGYELPNYGGDIHQLDETTIVAALSSGQTSNYLYNSYNKVNAIEWVKYFTISFKGGYSKDGYVYKLTDEEMEKIGMLLL